MTDRAFVPCGRCGTLIEVTDPDLLPVVGSVPVAVFHEWCTADASTMRRFRVSVSVTEEVVPDLGPGVEADPEPVGVDLLGVSATAEAATFVQALGDLERRLGELWAKVVDHAPVVDSLVEEQVDKPEVAVPSRLIVPR